MHIAADWRISAFRGDPGALPLRQRLRGRHLALGKSTELLGDHLVRFRRRLRPAFGDQGKQLLSTVHGLVADLEGSVAAAKTINQMLPLPG